MSDYSGLSPRVLWCGVFHCSVVYCRVVCWVLDVPGLCCTARCTPIHWLSVCRHYSHRDNTPASATRSLPPALLQLKLFILIFWMIELSAENLGFVFHQGLSGAQGPQGMDVNFTND